VNLAQITVFTLEPIGFTLLVWLQLYEWIAALILISEQQNKSVEEILADTPAHSRGFDSLSVSQLTFKKKEKRVKWWGDRILLLVVVCEGVNTLFFNIVNRDFQ